MIYLIVSLLAFALVALLSGNNLAVCSGAIISGRMVNRYLGISIAAVGYITGLLLQGNLLGKGLMTILPISSPFLVSVSLAVSTLIFVIGGLLRVPQSLSITFTMALLGVAIASGSAINSQYVSLIIAFWIAAPIVTVFLTFAVLRFATASMRKANIWKTLGKVKIALIILSFLSALTLGANTIGLLYVSVKAYASIWIFIVAILAGSFFLSSGPLRRIGEQILPIRYMNALVSQALSAALVELATLGSLPFSNTQAFTASLYGAALSYKTKIILRGTAFTILFTWVVTAVLSLAIGYVAVKVI